MRRLTAYGPHVFGSLELGSLFGIRIRASWTFVALLALLLLTGGGATSISWIGMLLLSVLLHELGHALVAQSFGIRVIDITFWPLGGMARMSEIPERPKVEAWIASAGPLVNFALALFSLPLVWVFERDGTGPPGPASIFVAINLALGVFNLIPAFPMDGGRLLRAGLALRLDWVAATESAVQVGRYVALAMVVFGILVLWPSGLFLMPLIGLFVFFAGASELVQVRLRHGLPPIGGAAAFPGGFPGGFPGAPNAGSRTADQARTAEASQPPPAPSGVEVEIDPGAGGARRPKDWDLELDGKPGFSSEDVRKLEQFRGRMRRDSDQL